MIQYENGGVMKKICFSLGIALLLFAVTVSVDSAKKKPLKKAAFKEFVDKENGFKMKYPSDWKTDKADPNYKILFHSEDKKAYVGVAVHVIGTETTAEAFHLEVEKNLGYKNELGEKDRIMDDAEKNKANVEDSYGGAYTVVEDGQEVKMIMLTLRKEDKIFAIIMAVETEASDKHKDTLLKMGQSFSAIESEQ